MTNETPSKALRPFRERHIVPKDIGFSEGWVKELTRSWSNGHYAVMSRDLDTEWGKVTHYFISQLSGEDIPWRDKQMIKNSIAGHDKLAIEVFPPMTELVNDADAYHIWVLHDKKLPFGLHFDNQRKDNGQ